MVRILNKRTDLIPHDAVYVGRPGPFGNPFIIGAMHNGVKITRDSAVDLHRDWIMHSDAGKALHHIIKHQRGKDWVCWCAPRRCHCEVLAEIANAV